MWTVGREMGPSEEAEIDRDRFSEDRGTALYSVDSGEGAWTRTAAESVLEGETTDV